MYEQYSFTKKTKKTSSNDRRSTAKKPEYANIRPNLRITPKSQKHQFKKVQSTKQNIYVMPQITINVYKQPKAQHYQHVASPRRQHSAECIIPSQKLDTNGQDQDRTFACYSPERSSRYDEPGTAQLPSNPTEPRSANRTGIEGPELDLEISEDHAHLIQFIE